MRTLVFLVACLVSGLSVAGRPVFHYLTLSDLVARSNVIVVAEPMASFDNLRDLKTRTCGELLRPFSIVEVVGMPPAGGLPSPVERGAELSVVMNPTLLTACHLEEILQNGTGASFQALAYRPQQHLVLRPGKPVLLFLRIRNEKYFIVTEGAVESVSKKQLVRSLLKKQVH